MPIDRDLLTRVARAYCGENSLTYEDFAGEGAFKATFRVSGADNEDPLALKVAAPGNDVRGEREVEAMLVCDHQCIAKLNTVDSYEHGGDTFGILVEEFLGGGTLSARLTEAALTREQVIELVYQLSGALQHLYEQGLVHRDIKPDNIMFREDSHTPILVDFGLVRDLDAESATVTLPGVRGPGTPYYSSPEQLTNDKRAIRWRADQFGLGVTAWHALTGQHPYQDGDAEALNLYLTRVARRESPPDAFFAEADRLDLAPLARMVRPWPVERFRLPDELIEAWSSLRSA